MGRPDPAGARGAVGIRDRHQLRAPPPEPGYDPGRLTALGVDVLAQGPEGLAALTKNDLEKWGPIVQKAGVKLD